MAIYTFKVSLFVKFSCAKASQLTRNVYLLFLFLFFELHEALQEVPKHRSEVPEV